MQYKNKEEKYIAAIENFINEISDNFSVNLQPETLKSLSNRFAKYLNLSLSGYKTDNLISKKDLLNNNYCSTNNNQIITLKNIEYFTYCADSFAPIYGCIHIGYIPKSFITTIGSLNRVVNTFTKRLQIQEKMLKDISDYLIEKLDPMGVIIVANAKHGCSSSESYYSLSNCYKSGVFCSDSAKIHEFFSILNVSL